MTRRQQAHAAKMRAKRGKRPYDEVHEDQARRYVARLHKLFSMGMSDEFIAKALDLDKHLVSILRHRRLRSSQPNTVVES